LPWGGVFSSKDFLKDIYKNFHFEPRKLYLGYFLDENLSPIDKILVVYFKAPHSYTGEDIVEYHCHGGVYLVQKIFTNSSKTRS